MRKYQREAPLDDEARHAGRHKKTRRWCKGRAGVEHDYGEAQVIWDSWMTHGFRMCMKVCRQCGKRDWKTYRVERRP